MADFGDLLARLTAAVVTPPAAGPLSTRLCTAVRDLSGATGAAITVAYGQPDRVTLANTRGYVDVKHPPNAAVAAATAAGVKPHKDTYLRYYVHQIGFVAVHGRNPGVGLQVSHLCDLPSCCRGDHTIDESAKTNIARKYCPGPGVLCENDHLYGLAAGQPGCLPQPPCYPLQKAGVFACVHLPGEPV